MAKGRTLKIVAAAAASFFVLAGGIVVMAQMGTISPEMAKLMLVALLAIYIGVGFLIAVYRLMDRLE